MAYFEVGIEYESSVYHGRTYTVTEVGRRGDLVRAERSDNGDNIAIAIVGDPRYERMYTRVNDEASYIPKDWS